MLRRIIPCRMHVASVVMVAVRKRGRIHWYTRRSSVDLLQDDRTKRCRKMDVRNAVDLGHGRFSNYEGEVAMSRAWVAGVESVDA